MDFRSRPAKMEVLLKTPVLRLNRSQPPFDRLGHFYKPLYATGKTLPDNYRAVKFCTCIVLQEKCKPGTSPGLVQQQYSELINKKTDNCLAVLLMYVPIRRVTPHLLLVWQCRREIVFLKQTSSSPSPPPPPPYSSWSNPAGPRRVICEVPDIIYCPGESYFKKWGQTVLNEPPI